MKGYVVYMILAVMIALPVIITPFFAEKNPSLAETVHGIYSPACHQLTSRSLCFFPSSLAIEDCFVTGAFNETKTETIDKAGAAGYKFPVCARDTGIYSFVLLGGIAFAFFRKPGEKTIPPAIWLIIALIPIGIDGGGQFLGLWESTNQMRLITGAIAGFAMPFYIVPMLNRLLDRK